MGKVKTEIMEKDEFDYPDEAVIINNSIFLKIYDNQVFDVGSKTGNFSMEQIEANWKFSAESLVERTYPVVMDR